MWFSTDTQASLRFNFYNLSWEILHLFLESEVMAPACETAPWCMSSLISYSSFASQGANQAVNNEQGNRVLVGVSAGCDGVHKYSTRSPEASLSSDQMLLDSKIEIWMTLVIPFNLSDPLLVEQIQIPLTNHLGIILSCTLRLMLNSKSKLDE